MRGLPRFFLIAILAACPVSFAAASPWHGALDHLIQAQNQSKPKDQAASLHAALAALDETRVAHDAVAQCKTLVETAIADLDRHDDVQARKDIALALMAARKGLQPRLSAQLPLSAPSPFLGTWETTENGRGTSTIGFTADGKWREDWRDVHLSGTWQPDPDNTGVTVQSNDRVEQFRVLHYWLGEKGHLIRELGFLVYERSHATANSSEASGFGSASATPPPVSDHPVVTVKLPEAQARAIVLIKGDKGEGTGFLVKTKDGPAVITNIHVIADNPNLQITTTMGVLITPLSYKAAADRDLAMMPIKDGPYSYLALASDVSSVAQTGDDVITPGNSQGGEVMLNTGGKVLGLGPQRVEIDNPVYHGNSGGPVIHVNGGQVIGVVTEAIKVDTSDELSKASFANRNSAIGHTMRYFAYRLDTVPGWEPLDLKRLQAEAAFIDAFDQRSRALDCFLNAPDDDKPEDIVWKDDEKIVKANNACADQSRGADAAQQMDAVRQLYSDLHDIANSNVAALQNTANFYGCNRQRAKDELAYRKALQAELDQIDKNVSRLGSLARSNK